MRLLNINQDSDDEDNPETDFHNDLIIENDLKDIVSRQIMSG